MVIMIHNLKKGGGVRKHMRLWLPIAIFVTAFISVLGMSAPTASATASMNHSQASQKAAAKAKAAEAKAAAAKAAAAAGGQQGGGPVVHYDAYDAPTNSHQFGPTNPNPNEPVAAAQARFEQKLSEDPLYTATVAAFVQNGVFINTAQTQATAATYASNQSAWNEANWLLTADITSYQTQYFDATYTSMGMIPGSGQGVMPTLFVIPRPVTLGWAMVVTLQNGTTRDFRIICDLQPSAPNIQQTSATVTPPPVVSNTVNVTNVTNNVNTTNVTNVATTTVTAVCSIVGVVTTAGNNSGNGNTVASGDTNVAGNGNGGNGCNNTPPPPPPPPACTINCAPVVPPTCVKHTEVLDPATPGIRRRALGARHHRHRRASRHRVLDPATPGIRRRALGARHHRHNAQSAVPHKSRRNWHRQVLTKARHPEHQLFHHPTPRRCR